MSEATTPRALYHTLSPGVRERIDKLLVEEKTESALARQQPQSPKRDEGAKSAEEVGVEETSSLSPCVTLCPENDDDDEADHSLSNLNATTVSPDPNPPRDATYNTPNSDQQQQQQQPAAVRPRRLSRTTFAPNVPPQPSHQRRGSIMSRGGYSSSSSVGPGVFHRVGWGGLPGSSSGSINVSGGGSGSSTNKQSGIGYYFGQDRSSNKDGGRSNGSSDAGGGSTVATRELEELRMRLHQLEFQMSLGKAREQQWFTENMTLREELRELRIMGYTLNSGMDDDNDRSMNSQATIAAATHQREDRERGGEGDDGDDEEGGRNLPPVSNQLLLLHLEADEAAMRSRVEADSMAEMWGTNSCTFEGSSSFSSPPSAAAAAASSSSSPSPPSSSLWVSFLHESHRASLISHRAAILHAQQLQHQLRFVTESNTLKTRENCILLDQLQQMQKYHDGERKQFRDKLLDVAQLMSGNNTPRSLPPSVMNTPRPPPLGAQGGGGGGPLYDE